MKSLILAILAAIPALITMPIAANADDKADIAALYARLQTAMKAQSPDLMLPLLAPDFSYKDRKGNVLNRKQFADQLNVQKKEVTVKDIKLKIIRSVVKGKAAKVTNEFSWSMDIVDTVGQTGPKGKGTHHTLASTGSVENDLEKTPKGWRFLTLNTVNGKMTMDGKPMQHRTDQPAQQNSK